MTERKTLVLGDDLPKHDPWQDDRLGYAPFAKAISEVLINTTAPNGYVLGLHGKWGSGKSTMINFIIKYINENNVGAGENTIIHVDFRPWIISGHQDLISAFFKLLSEQIDPENQRWKRVFKRWFKCLRSTTDSAVDAAAIVALTVDPSGGVASRFGSGVTKKSVNTLLSRFLEDPSLQKAYEDLRNQLYRSGKRFFITIDDIDRLNEAEVVSIMQLAKSIGQLPNVIYLLAYDRDTVWNILDQPSSSTNPRFAEKIVQQELELPQPTKSDLLAILDKEVGFLIAGTPQSLRWEYIVREGIRRWVRSPRDVVRLSNAVKFAWPALENEIDAQDLLAIEGLRLFDRIAFNWIRDNRDFLFSQGSYFLSDDDDKKAAAERMKACVPEDVRPQVLKVVSVLFPQMTKWLEGENFSDQESYLEIRKRRGIGSEAGYDAYFGMHPSSDEIPKAVIDDLMLQLDDLDHIESVFRTYMGGRNRRGELMVGKLLEELRAQYKARQAARPTQALLDTLCRVGEDIIGIDQDFGIFELPPRSQISALIRDVLEQWDSSEAGERLIEAFEKGTSPAFLADVYVERGRELGIFEGTARERPIIGNDVFEELGAVLLQKIKTAVEEGTLSRAPFFFDIARAWAHLEGSEPVKAWLNDGMLESAEFMWKVGHGLVGYSLGTEERHYTMRDKPEPELYDLKTLIEAGKKHLKSAELTKDQRNLIGEVVRGSERILQGESSEETKREVRE